MSQPELSQEDLMDDGRWTMDPMDLMDLMDMDDRL